MDDPRKLACPLRGCKLLLAAIGEWRTGLGWIAGGYCPLCDAAILFHQDADGGPWVHALWRRSANSWVLAEQCRETLSLIERRGHGRWCQPLWDAIAKILAERAEPDLKCPLYCWNDGSRIAEMFRTQYGGVRFRYSW